MIVFSVVLQHTLRRTRLWVSTKECKQERKEKKRILVRREGLELVEVSFCNGRDGNDGYGCHYPHNGVFGYPRGVSVLVLNRISQTESGGGSPS